MSSLPVLDVTGRDFNSLVQILRLRAINRFDNLPQTDFNFSNFAAMFIDLFAGVGDGANFYIDNVAQDLFWESVRDRDNAIRLGKLIAFNFRSSIASQVTLRFEITKPSAGNVVIPARTQVQTNDPETPIIFETLTQATILAGQISVEVIAENAQLITEEFVSNDQPRQVFTVDNAPYVEGSASVLVNNVQWNEVEDFFNSETISQDYLAEIDGEDRLSIEFGDGEQGAIPSGDIELSYKIGGGASGNVFAGTIVVLEKSFTDIFSNPVTMFVSNTVAANGGRDRESVAEARFRAPRSVKTNERTIAREDFEINALDVAGISRAKVFTSDNNALIPENTGFLYIVPVGGGAPTLALRDEVREYLTTEKPTTLGFVLNVVSPNFIPISFNMKVFVKDPSFKADVKASLEQAFEEYFSETILSGDNAGQPNFEMDFEKAFFNSEVICVAQDANEQVRNIELITDLETTYNLAAEDFPIKGTLVFEDGDTGLPLA